MTLGNNNNSIQQTIDKSYDKYLALNNSYYSTCDIEDYIEYQDSYTFVEPTIPLDGPMDSPWAMYCHDVRHTGRSPYSTADTEGIEKWRFATDNDECSGSPIIDNEGIIYVGASDLIAVYPNATMKWIYKTDGFIASAPALDENGILYFGAVWGSKLHALYSSNGTVKWKYNGIGSTWASPTVGEDGIIYVPATDNYKVHAVYPNGTRKWVFKASERVYSSPAIGDDGTIYCTSYNGNLYALYPENGTEKWEYKVGSHIRTSPCIADDGTIYTVSTDGPLFAFNPDGTVKWNSSSVGGGTSPTIGQDQTIYCGYKDLYAVNPIDGSIKWICDIGGNRRIKDGTPCNSIDGTIYLGTYIGDFEGGDIIAVNPNGTIKWRKKIASGYVMSAPAIGSNGTVYIGSWNDGTEPWAWGYLHAFGPVESNSPPETPTLSGPVHCKIRGIYKYIVVANDPDNNPISYLVNFGDGVTTGWIDDLASGEEYFVYHKWYDKGNFTIKAKARDTFGEESDWVYLDVVVPRTRTISYLWYEWFLERISMLEQLLNL